MKLKIQMKLPITYLVRYGKAFVALAMMVIFGLMLWFLYSNVYLPLTQATFLAELESKVALIAVNKKDLKEVLEAITRKGEPAAIDWKNARNPFIITSPTVTDAEVTPNTTTENPEIPPVPASTTPEKP